MNTNYKKHKKKFVLKDKMKKSGLENLIHTRLIEDRRSNGKQRGSYWRVDDLIKSKTEKVPKDKEWPQEKQE